MKWITREKIKVDPVARPCLVYDVPGCELGHHGEEVSFDSILKRYQLTGVALHVLAQIVRAADSHPSQPHPAGEGLRSIAHGFSALGLSDQNILDREFDQPGIS